MSDWVPEILIGDPGRFRQIIMNLVGNSVKVCFMFNVIPRFIDIFYTCVRLVTIYKVTLLLHYCHDTTECFINLQFLQVCEFAKVAGVNMQLSVA